LSATLRLVEPLNPAQAPAAAPAIPGLSRQTAKSLPTRGRLAPPLPCHHSSETRRAPISVRNDGGLLPAARNQR
jgi:hypothetical protein